jgi:hypothetical protein
MQSLLLSRKGVLFIIILISFYGLFTIIAKPGFKSITVSEYVYSRFFEFYEKNRKGFEVKGITSFSGYLTSMMDEIMMKYEAFAKHIPLIEEIALDSDRVLLNDNKCNRIIEVLLTNGELQCLLDESSHCIHVGFCIFAVRVIFCNQIQGSRSPKSVHIDLRID